MTMTGHPTAERTRESDTSPVDVDHVDKTGTVTLSDLEIKIVRLMADGYEIDAVARRLNLSGRTIRRRTQEMRDRLGARAPIQVVVWAAKRGLI